MALPQFLYSTADLRTLEHFSITNGISEISLMERAGEAALRVLRDNWPFARRLLIICGTGNNGGDGFVLARLAHMFGLKVQVELVGEFSHLHGAAHTAFTALVKNQVPYQLFEVSRKESTNTDVIVDALIGIGLNRNLEGIQRTAVAWINQQGTPVLAMDIPSGLHADTGRILGTAVKASHTISFIALKRGMYTGTGPEYCGNIFHEDLGVPKEGFSALVPAAIRLIPTWLQDLLPCRSRSGQKGDYGHVLVIGGAPGMAGAALMAGEAAIRAGAGLVSIASHPSHAPYLNIGRPELMCHGVEKIDEMIPLLKRATVVALGPGLSTGTWGRTMMGAALESKQHLVVDADALNLLAQSPLYHHDWILTPHPGEAARLLNVTTAEIQADRYTAVRELQCCYGGIAVLKGSGSLVSDGKSPVAVCDRGNPGMASGGAGDILTGVIAGLWAQKLTAWQAACAGVYVHAVAGDIAAQKGERGMIASDILHALRYAVNPSGFTAVP